MEHKKSVMIALLPVATDWCRIELPHLTLVYAGEVDDLTPSDYNEFGKQVLDISRTTKPISLDVIGVDVFGDDEEPVDVLTLEKTAELSALRSRVEHWNASQHDYTPHVTVGPVGSLDGNIPNKLLFDRVLLQWGDRGFSCFLSPPMDEEKAVAAY